MGAGGSSSILDSLNTANEALNGPVKVKRNAEGLTVTYTNETEKPQKCSGLVLPYDQVVAKGLDKPDGPSGLNLLGTLFDIVNQGNSAVLFYEKDADGVKQPASLSGADAKGKASKGTMGATTSGLLPPLNREQTAPGPPPRQTRMRSQSSCATVSLAPTSPPTRALRIPSSSSRLEISWDPQDLSPPARPITPPSRGASPPAFRRSSRSLSSSTGSWKLSRTSSPGSSVTNFPVLAPEQVSSRKALPLLRVPTRVPPARPTQSWSQCSILAFDPRSLDPHSVLHGRCGVRPLHTPHALAPDRAVGAAGVTAGSKRTPRELISPAVPWQCGQRGRWPSRCT